jgi:hypothetical protein
MIMMMMMVVMMVITEEVIVVVAHKKKNTTLETGLTELQKLGILHQFNLARSTVKNPTAAGMPQLVWDDNLAAEAQVYIQGCQIQGNFPNYKYGYNLYRDQGPNPVKVAKIRSVDQAKYFDYTTGGCKSEKKSSCDTIQIYSEIIDDNVTAVGCGLFPCNGPKVYYHACAIYYEKIESPNVYVGGTPCSACPDSMPYCNKDLCTATKPPV